LPVIALGSPDARFQPVYVGDVVKAYLAALDDRDSAGKRYDLCGPHECTLRELMEFVCAVTGRTRLIIGLPERLSYLQAWAMELLPVKLLTRGQLRFHAGAERLRRRVSVRHPAGGAGSHGARLARALGPARALSPSCAGRPAGSRRSPRSEILRRRRRGARRAARPARPGQDFVVVGATPEQMAAAGYKPVGKDFPVFLHPQTHEEYALARTESKSGRGYKGFTVHARPT
jgi:hypothetical protein